MINPSPSESCVWVTRDIRNQQLSTMPSGQGSAALSGFCFVLFSIKIMISKTVPSQPPYTSLLLVCDATLACHLPSPDLFPYMQNEGAQQRGGTKVEGFRVSEPWNVLACCRCWQAFAEEMHEPGKSPRKDTLELP